MASTALGLMALYMLMGQTSKVDIESRFQKSRIVPDVISTAPLVAAEVYTASYTLVNWDSIYRLAVYRLAQSR